MRLPPYDNDQDEKEQKLQFKTIEEKETVILEYLKNPESIKRDPMLSNVYNLFEHQFFEQNEKDKRIIYYKNKEGEKYYLSYCNIIYEKVFHLEITIDELIDAVKWGLLFDNSIMYDPKMVNRIFQYGCKILHFEYINLYFQNVKALTVNDFLYCSFTELLAYRDRIHIKNSFYV